MSRGKPPKTQAKPQTQRPVPVPTTVTATGQQSALDLAIYLGLLVSVLAIYAQVGQFPFVNYDDSDYVYDNPMVKGGLTVASIKWAFTAVVVSNWMPVTLLSHMLDCQLFGLTSGMHHLVNVLFHALSAVLLFMLLKRATQARWPSAFVAFMFALHPLHVESVAWVAERKDVLSTFFWFLAMYCYVRYAERPNLGRYLLVVAPFCLGLMSKPMLVTFPFALLLFDIWPLRRIQRGGVRWPRLLWEKVPLMALAAGAAAITYSIQGSSGAFILILPLATRLKNALNTYLIYLLQTLRPVRLAAIYPYPTSIATWPAVVALVILLAVSALVIYAWWRKKRPYYAVGWFWYVGTLVPVIGLVQVGFQSHADRYTYIPLIGFSIMLAWGAVDAVEKWPWIRTAIIPVAIFSCLLCMVAASAQAAYWRDTETLFKHALAVTQDNWVAHNNLGQELKAQGRCAEAIPHFESVIRLRPDYSNAKNYLSYCLVKIGRATDAVSPLEQLVRDKPEAVDAHLDLGEALSRIPGRELEAIPHLQAALRARPDVPETNNDLGACYLNIGRVAEAVPYFEKAVGLKPDSPDMQFNLALALSKIPAKAADSIPHFEAAVRLKPDYAAAQHSFGLFLARRGRTEEAISHLQAAVRVNPDDYVNERDLGMFLSSIPGKQSDAMTFLQAAQRLHADPQVAKTLERLQAGK